MGVMNKMRESTGAILWILVFAFGVIWVLQDSGGLDTIGQVGNNIGSVNGDPISVDEYNQAVDQQVQSYQNQTGDTMPPQMLDQTRDRVFNQLVEARLREQEMERLGLGVSDDELVDMIQGDDPHPIIKAYFSDGNGGVDRALLQNFIANPDAAADWINIENYLRSERRRQKLENLINSSVRITEADIAEEYAQRNKTVDVRYVALRYSSLPDDQISYDDGDLRSFYNDHRDEFAREKTFDLSYVTVSKAPTAADSAAILADVEALKDSFAAAENDSLFLARNGSERPWADAYFRPDELADDIAGAVFSNIEEGSVVGPIVSGGQVHLIKVIDVRPPEETAVKARHILFRATEGDDDARAEALTEARDVRRQLLNGGDFAQLAAEYSDDGTAQRGGDLGWFGPGRMVAPFEEAAFGARIGQIVGPVETQFGYHLIEVTDRATEEAQIADFALTLRASVQTLNRVQSNLDDLQYFSAEEGDFTGEAGRRNLDVRTVSIEEEQQFIPGLGNSRALVNFLAGAEEGDISPVIELNDFFLVASVETINEAGFQPFDEVRAQLEPRLRNELKAEVQAQKMEEALANGGFEGLADRLSTAEREAAGLSFANQSVPGIGRDGEFVGTALAMQDGGTSDVIQGANAVYVIHVVKVNTPGAIQPSEYTSLQNQLRSRQQNIVRSQWITALRESADIEDNRRIFLQ
ncbi:MAG: peptidyl-prolyl cis-trans isomerase [Rhodothermales bacterium]